MGAIIVTFVAGDGASATCTGTTGALGVVIFVAGGGTGGGNVFTVTEIGEFPERTLPARSCGVPLTLMLSESPLMPNNGVKVAVQTEWLRAFWARLLSVPPLAVMAAWDRSLTASLKVKVTVEVSPAFTVALSLVTTTVGATVSTVIETGVLVERALPATSCGAPLTVMLSATPLIPAVGV